MKDETVAQGEDSRQIRFRVEIWVYGEGVERLFAHDIRVETIEPIKTLVMQAVKR